MSHETLRRRDGETIAYERIRGSAPGVIFLHGLMSDRGGTKAEALAAHCLACGYGYLRFDMFGHGDSSGRFEDGNVSRWVEDSLAVVDELTAGPQILVGSSMGGWVMLRVAALRPKRIAAAIGIAAGPDFTTDIVESHLTPDQRTELMTKGALELPSEYNAPYRFTRQLIEDGAANLVLDKPIVIDCPVRLLQGQRDDAVPWRRALAIAERITGEDVDVTILKDGDHRLSRPQDLARLCATVDDLVALVRKQQGLNA